MEGMGNLDEVKEIKRKEDCAAGILETGKQIVQVLCVSITLGTKLLHFTRAHLWWCLLSEAVKGISFLAQMLLQKTML